MNFIPRFNVPFLFQAKLFSKVSRLVGKKGNKKSKSKSKNKKPSKTPAAAATVPQQEVRS